MKSLVCLASFLALCGAAVAADPVVPAMREVSPGVYEIGAIRIDRGKRSAVFPGTVNLVEGNLEYLIVTAAGATHESLLSTEVQPSDLHFAMLLLGARGAGLAAPAPEDAPPAQINKEYLAHAPELKGDRIQIAVKWKAGGAEKTVPVEDWVFNTDANKPAPHGPWLYTGSMFSADRFLAQTEGAIAALVHNPAALINNPRKGSDNDQVWMPNQKAMPPRDTPVEITITLEPEPAEK